MRDILLTLDEMLKQDLENLSADIKDVDDRTDRARSNWWRRFWDTAVGARDKRIAERKRLTIEHTAANQRLRHLAEQASAVSPSAEYARVRPWN